MNTENSRTNYDRRNLSPSLPNLWTMRLSYLIELAIQLVHRNHLNISLFLKNYSSCWDASNRFILLHKISTLVGRYNVVLVNYCYNRAIYRIYICWDEISEGLLFFRTVWLGLGLSFSPLLGLSLWSLTGSETSIDLEIFFFCLSCSPPLKLPEISTLSLSSFMLLLFVL